MKPHAAATVLTEQFSSNEVGVSQAVRRANVRAVFNVILDFGPINARDISARADISKVTVNSIVRELKDLEAVSVTGYEPSPRGPAAAVYSVRAECGFAVGLTVNHHTISAECVDILGGSRAVVMVDRDPRVDSPTEVARAARTVLQRAGVAEVNSVVVGLPTVNRLAFAETLAVRLGRAVDVRSNIELACHAESAAQATTTFVQACMEPDPAVAVLVDGQVFLGPAEVLAQRWAPLSEVVMIATAMFGTRLVVLAGDWSSPKALATSSAIRAEAARRLGATVRVVAGLAGAEPSLRGAVAYGLRQARQSVIDSRYPEVDRRG